MGPVKVIFPLDILRYAPVFFADILNVFDSYAEAKITTRFASVNEAHERFNRSIPR